MPGPFPISDLYLYPLELQDGRLVILHEDQHVLRRFGSLEQVSLDAGATTPFTVRAEADQIWTPLSGQVFAMLVDLRPASPSHGERLEMILDAADPQGLLVPFGVAARLDSPQGASLLWLSTHAAAHPEDRVLQPSELPAAPSP